MVVSAKEARIKVNTTRRALIRDFGIALSFANIAFLRVWTQQLSFKPAASFTIRTAVARVSLEALMLNVLVLAIVVWLAIVLGRFYLPPKIHRIGRAIFMASAAARHTSRVRCAPAGETPTS
jgi:hypothetical protein